MKIHHIGFLTKNLKKSVEEFIKLGYEIEYPAKFDSIRKINILFLINGDYRLELIEPINKESPLYPLLKHYNSTPYHICYETKNFYEDIKSFSENGYSVFDEPKTAPCISYNKKENKVCFLINPSSGIIELLEC